MCATWCPVYDLNQDINYIGKFQTVNRRGGMILSKRWHPQGFFLVFVAKGDDSDCTSRDSLNPWSIRGRSFSVNHNRTSKIHFKIKPTLSESEYIFNASVILIAMLCFYIVSAALTMCCFRENTSQGDCTLSENDGVICTLQVSQDVAESRLSMSNLMMCHMAFRDPKYSQKFSLTYLWHVISIAIFYGIPVVQLAVTYQRVVNTSGDQDICYYNFLCAYPLLGFSDTNHIISNTGYVVMGVLFLVITLFRNKRAKERPQCGIPRHNGLYYAMGVALIMEGVLSASYHICPNQSNFQFDTSFMYVMAVLCMIKLYQNRHPEVNATSHATFLVLGLSIWFAMVGILNNGLTIWILFVIFHVLLCFYISANIYFLSYLKKGVKDFIGGLKSDSSTIYQRLAPRRKEHFILLVITNLLNIMMACGGISSYFYEIDFATFLLGILMANAIIYVIVYTTMKLLYKERICKTATTFGILALVTWGFAGFFFVQNSTSWNLTPAQSKRANRECDFLQIYDFHDIWHLLSAAALFFSFMLLLTLDDDLINTHHSKIHVF